MKKNIINKVVKQLIKNTTGKKKTISKPHQPHQAQMRQIELESIRMQIKQLNESAKIVNTTTNPLIFFSRYHFMMDTLLNLMEYDDSYFKGITIREQYDIVYNKIEDAVNDMIDRTYKKEAENAAKLKNKASQKNRMLKYFSNMETVFNKSNDIWEGHHLPTSGRDMPHYTGELYTPANLEKLLNLKEMVLKDYS